jgi:hypothetical protein
MIKSFVGAVVFTLGLSLAGCASDAEPEESSTEDALSTLPASDDTQARTEQVAVVWACNFPDETSVVFVQEGPRKPRGRLFFFGHPQRPFATRSELAGATAGTGLSPAVTFKRLGNRVEFRAGAALSLVVDLDQKLSLGTIQFPWTGAEPDRAPGGCWGPVR